MELDCGLEMPSWFGRDTRESDFRPDLLCAVGVIGRVGARAVGGGGGGGRKQGACAQGVSVRGSLIKGADKAEMATMSLRNGE